MRDYLEELRKCNFDLYNEKLTSPKPILWQAKIIYANFTGKF